MLDLHGRGIIHKDIKPANIRLDSKGQAVLFDFSRACEVADPVFDRLGTLLYTPPEVLLGQRVEDRRAWDVWSFGCLLFNACFLRLPFEGSSAEEVEAAVLKGVSLEGNPHPGASGLIASCLEKEPGRRATMQAVVQHPWLQP